MSKVHQLTGGSLLHRLTFVPVLLSLGLIWPALAFAQTDDLFALNEPEETPQETLPSAVGLWPASTSVVTGQELLRRGYRTLGDALADIVGVDVVRSTQSPSFGMRGIPEGLLLVIDGLPWLVEGQRDLLDVDEGLNLHDVERVEVIRGPVSALTGVGALGGVVRVTTRRPSLTGARLRLATTHLGEREVSAQGSARYDALAARLSVLHRQGPAGIWHLQNVPTKFIRVGGAVVPGAKQDNVEIIPQDDSNTLVRLTVQVAELQLDLDYMRSDAHTPVSSYSHGLLDTGPQQRRFRERQGLRLRFERALGPVRIDAQSYATRHLRTDRIILYPSRGLFRSGGRITVDSESLTSGLLITGTLPIRRHHRLAMTVFGDLARYRAETSAIDPNGQTEMKRLVAIDELNATATWALEYQGDFGAGWHLTAGSALEWRTGYQSTIVPRAALSYLPLPWLNLRLAYAEGSRNPDRYDLTLLTQAVISGRAIGAAANPDLLPEHVRSLELAARIEPSARLHSELTLFASRHESALEAVVVGARMVPQNLPARVILGGELLASIEAVPSLVDLEAGVSLARTVDGPALEGHLAVLHASAELTPLEGLVLGARGRAAWRVTADAAQGSASGLAEVFASYLTFDDRLSLTLALRNAIDSPDLIPDRAALSGTSNLAAPSRGRILYLAVEGRL